MLQKREEQIKVTVQNNDKVTEEHERFLNYDRDRELKRIQSEMQTESAKQVESPSKENQKVDDMMQEEYGNLP